MECHHSIIWEKDTLFLSMNNLTSFPSISSIVKKIVIFEENYDIPNLKNVIILFFRLNIPFVYQAYGLTETGLAVTIMEKGVIRSGSVGKAIVFTSLKIRDPETGKSLGPNQVGEICVKGPQVMKGYYNNSQATRETFTSNGWLKTGDLGYYDKEEYFYIVDRLKELIKYNAYQVFK